MDANNGSQNGPYKPLNSDNKEIRLLLVKAGKGDQPIECELQHTSLQSKDRPEYETVSYCWGDAAQKATIVLHGVETSVPLSSKTVLARVRKARKDRLIWIDAICINQSDVAERGQQVALMEEIYSGTVQNLIWLGEGTPDVNKYALFLLDLVYSKAMRATDDGKYFYEIACETLPQEDLGVPVIKSHLVEFFSSPWFQRVWIIQEALLPPKSLVYAGTLKIDFEKVLLAATWLEHIAPLMNFRPLDRYIGMLNCARIYRLGHEKKKDFAEVLDAILTFQATDPRDFVYGVLGLYQRFTGSKGQLPDLLKPDYNKPVIEVMRDVTRFVIQQGPNLQYLRLLRYRQETVPDTSGIPSWVEPWHLGESKRVFCANFRYSHYAADNGVPMRLVEDGTDPNILSLAGIIVDTIGPLTPHLDTDPELLKALLESSVSPICIEKMRNEPERIGAALIAESTHSAARSTPEDARLCIKWAEYIIEHGERPRERQRWQRGQTVYGFMSAINRVINKLGDSDDEEAEEEPEDPEWEKLVEYDEAVMYASHHRRIFETMSTKRLGLAPANAGSGCVIAVLYGCEWPVVLRREGEEYQFVEVCYVNGVMDGEAVREHKESGKEDVVFRIR